ncbi:MAG TPA: DNA topoisomerase I [Pyrodictium delaneyi]|uniref:DNA topoisomerase n=1 Tax=Pyrodictium delaneyi TaxID=1273541 RepID=A0A833E991_9CREN|nr:DNA topoisomerase I [Pyrodictium delaneyi]
MARRRLQRDKSSTGCATGHGYVLVIAEKPKAARKIAEALSSGARPKLCRLGKVPYWLVLWNGRLHVIASAAGHLFGLTTDERGFPVFSYYWAPLWRIDSSASYTKRFFEVLETLAGRAAVFINACDYDIEGSVIGYMIIKSLGDVKRAYRAKFSALTRQDIQRAFRRLEPLDWDMIEAGLARHELDWIWGVNVSRALMDSVSSVTGRRIVLSAGRVQSPTLIEVVVRNKEINLFVPLPSFAVNVTIALGDYKHTGRIAVYETRQDALEAAEKLRQTRFLKVVYYREWRERLLPPYPFNLSDLQAEAARLFGYSPMFTQRVAEQLYLDGLISYPRTNSQKMPESIDVAAIVRNLARIGVYRNLVDYLLRTTGGILRPRNGPKDDPAHPAIHPTGEVSSTPLTGAQKKIYDLIVRRFLASMASPAILTRTHARLAAPGIGFFELSGLRILDYGWLRIYYFAAPKESQIPRLKVGDIVDIKRVSVRIAYSSPPEPYTKASLVKWMERMGIGTEATRARIVELLFERGYLTSRGKRIDVTELGYAVARVLAKYFPQLTSIELTRYFEEHLEAIRARKTSRSAVIDEAKRLLSSILAEFKKSAMESVGMELAKALNIIKPGNTCTICQREATETGLCHFHQEALQRLLQGYIEWRRRTGVGCLEFLQKIAQLSSAGHWVREVATYFARQGKCPFSAL